MITNEDYDKQNSEGYLKYTENAHKKYEKINIMARLSDFKEKINNESFSAIDLGCGSGTYTRILRNYTDGEIVGIDISEHMIEIAKEEEKKNNLVIDYKVADCLANLQELLDEKKFDLITAIFLFNYSANESILKESLINVKSLLKDGGYFIGIIHDSDKTTPSRRVLTKKFNYEIFSENEEIGKEQYEDGDKMKFRIYNSENVDKIDFEVTIYNYSLDTYRKAFENAGFTVELFDLQSFDDSDEAKDFADFHVGKIFIAY
jgi:ubiquinone/menaquinone biosynthesis C-methylase UbiE